MTYGGKRQPVGTSQERPRIGLVVPALEEGGGIAAVAEFVCETIERSQAFNLRIVSLAMSSRNPLSLSLTRPASWLRGVTTSEGTWQGRRFIRVGSLCVGTGVPTLSTTSRIVRGARRLRPGPGRLWIPCLRPGCLRTRKACRRALRHSRGCRTARSSCHVQGPSEAWRRWMTMITDRLDRKRCAPWTRFR